MPCSDLEPATALRSTVLFHGMLKKGMTASAQEWAPGQRMSQFPLPNFAIICPSVLQPVAGRAALAGRDLGFPSLQNYRT